MAEILYINEEEKHFLTLDIERTNEGITRWLERRIIPKSRTLADKILKTLDLSHNDTKGIFDFPEILALVAYTGAGVYRIPGADYRRYTPQGMAPCGAEWDLSLQRWNYRRIQHCQGAMLQILRFSGCRDHATKHCTLRPGEVGRHSNIEVYFVYQYGQGIYSHRTYCPR